MNRNYLIIICAILLMNCKKSDSSNNGVAHDIYVCGWEMRPTDYPDYMTIPKYWVNGKAVYLPDATYKDAVATGISFIGNDVYVAGDSSSSRIPFYWKNGKPRAVNAGSILSDNDLKAAITANNQFWKYAAGLPYNLTGTNHFPHVTVNAVCISGMDIYAVGAVDNILFNLRGPNSGSSLAVYWKNGVMIPLEDSLNYNLSSQGISIQVIGNDVYVAGFGLGGGVYWKNGIRNPFNGNVQTWGISGITVVGNNVYVSGQSPYGNTPVAQYWINGIAYELNNSAALYYLSESSNGISVKDNKVYSAGRGYNLITNSAVYEYAIYWVNNQPTILNNATSRFEEATGIFVK